MSTPEEMLRDEALWDEKSTTDQALIYGFSFGLAAIPTGLGFWWFASARDSEVFLIAISVVFMMVLFAAMFAIERILAGRRVAQLRAIGRGFDVDGYLTAISQRRRTAQLLVKLSFAPALDEPQQQTVVGVAGTWVPGFTTRWSEDKLVLESGSLETIVRSRAHRTMQSVAERTNFNNQAIHRALRQVLAALPDLDTLHPIAKIETEVVGVIAAPGERAYQ